MRTSQHSEVIRPRLPFRERGYQLHLLTFATNGFHSAGGSSVFQQILAFGGRNDNLFRGGMSPALSCSVHHIHAHFTVIAESAYWAPLMSANRTAIYEATWQKLLNLTGCSNIACLQNVPLAKFNASVAQIGAGSFNPVVDGDFIKRDPAAQVSDGQLAKVQLIVGGEFWAVRALFLL
jgi:carboxylesterase type B